MSQSGVSMPPSKFVDGFQVPPPFSAESFRSAVRYQPRPGDIFIVTYPKCGTTWAQQILDLILRKGSQPLDTESFGSSPFLELKGAKSAETMSRPGAIKTHLPFNLAPWSEHAKYIFVARNPKDCCVSYYHHHVIHGFAGTFDQFFEAFLSGKINFGDYFDHLMSWYERRNCPNVLFLTYEEMKESPEDAILKIASFIDDEKYAEPLRRDPEKLLNVVKYSSFRHMKEVVNKTMGVESPTSAEKDSLSGLSDKETKPSTEVRKKDADKEKQGKFHMAGLVRKGIVGDWKSHFSIEQNERLNQKFAGRTKGTEIADIWTKYM